ncbi:MAG: nucleoside hydrolase [Verrucomicrobia bacterium]|nr:nucleoside hydrolase [Verrucomicrobiota bacterium]
MRPVIFDTDIGTDVDDILALVLLARAPELKLLGVTTVYGDTAFRARMAKVTTHMLGREDIAIVPGEQHPLSGRQIHWAGHEGEGIPQLDSFEVKTEQTAPRYIGEIAEALDGELEVIATGPLTNIATAITAAPSSCARIKHLYIMGGAFWMNRAEHNMKCDADAARVVFSSGIPMTVISLDLTLRVFLGKKELPRIAALPNGLGPLLENQLIRWWQYQHVEGSCPHDPLAALAMVRPELFRFENYDIRVHDEASAPGFTSALNRESGKVRVGVDVFARTAEQEILQRILGKPSAGV